MGSNPIRSASRNTKDVGEAEVDKRQVVTLVVAAASAVVHPIGNRRFYVCDVCNI